MGEGRVNKHPEHITVYRVIGAQERTCSLGQRHKVRVYLEKHLTLTDRVRINPNAGGVLSYSDTERINPIYEDAQGRSWNRYASVDYSGNITFVGPDDNHWTKHKPEGVRYDQAEVIE